jgi:hypothetical protein
MLMIETTTARRRARLAIIFVASGDWPSRRAISTNGTANMSCSTSIGAER